MVFINTIHLLINGNGNSPTCYNTASEYGHAYVWCERRTEVANHVEDARQDDGHTTADTVYDQAGQRTCTDQSNRCKWNTFNPVMPIVP